MPAVTQPSGMTSAKGVILTIGIRSHGDRCAMVLPMVADTASADDKQLCEDACESADANLMASIVACLSESAYVSFIEAQGMMDGLVPHRIDYGPADNPGTGTAGAEPSQIGGLLIFYADPEDINEGNRIRVGKTTVPGIPDDDVVNGVVDSGLAGYLDSLAQVLSEGYTNSGSGGGKWYRVCSAPDIRTFPQDIIRTGKYLSRGYLGTQRRRITPH